MKKIIIFFVSLVVAFSCAAFSKLEKKVQTKLDSIEILYADAVDMMLEQQAQGSVDEQTIFKFFGQFDLASKKNFKRLKKTHCYLQKKLSKKALQNHVGLKTWSKRITQLYNFVKEQKNQFYVLSVAQDIGYFYRNYDPLHKNLLQMINNNPKMFGIKSRRYAIYALAKKLDVDMRRLKHLFASYKMSNSLATFVNSVKTKIMQVREQVLSSVFYKQQRRGMRIWKAIGVLAIFVPLTIVSLAGVSAAFMLSSATATLAQIQVAAEVATLSYYAGLALGATLGVVSAGITIKEMVEAYRYKIPVHSTSLFSWFTPVFLPLAWIPRG